jgi:hypothetical protein
LATSWPSDDEPHHHNASLTELQFAAKTSRSKASSCRLAVQPEIILLLLLLLSSTTDTAPAHAMGARQDSGLGATPNPPLFLSFTERGEKKRACLSIRFGPILSLKSRVL